jgi:hypothetical protein
LSPEARRRIGQAMHEVPSAPRMPEDPWLLRSLLDPTLDR